MNVIFNINRIFSDIIQSWLMQIPFEKLHINALNLNFKIMQIFVGAPAI